MNSAISALPFHRDEIFSNALLWKFDNCIMAGNALQPKDLDKAQPSELLGLYFAFS